MNRKIVIDTGALHLLNDDKLIFELLVKGGFKYYDYSLYWKGGTEHIGVGEDFRENALKVRKLADSYGLICEQTHGYFTGGCDEESINRRIDYIKKDIESTSILGAKIMVLHPILEWNAEQNIEWIKTNFLPLAHKFNVKIAIENCWTVINDKKAPMCTSRPNDFVNFIDAFNDDFVIACLDIGHAEMNQCGTSAVEMIEALGPRLQALHIHDNDKWCDAHQVPYTQKIDFSKVLNSLKENNYQGNITFEVETCYNRGEEPTASLPFELYPAFIRLQKEIGDYFANYLDK